MAASRRTAEERTDDEAPGFTAEERAAIKERATEVRSGRRKSSKDPEAELLAKVAELPDDDRAIAERLHAIVRAHAPGLTPKTWYGMPAYARDGKVVLFLQPASKFSTRYATLGFNDDARLDDGAVWPTAYALTRLTDAEEPLVRDLVVRAAG